MAKRTKIRKEKPEPEPPVKVKKKRKKKRKKKKKPVVPGVEVVEAELSEIPGVPTEVTHTPSQLPMSVPASPSVHDPHNVEGLIESVSDWITSRAAVTPAQARALDDNLTSNKTKFKVFLQVMGTKKVQRLQRMLGCVDQIEDEIFSPERIASADQSELIRMWSLLSDEIGVSLDFLQKITEDTDAPINVLQMFAEQAAGGEDEAPGKFQDLSPAQRDRVRMLAELLLALKKTPGSGANGKSA